MTVSHLHCAMAAVTADGARCWRVPALKGDRHTVYAGDRQAGRALVNERGSESCSEDSGQNSNKESDWGGQRSDCDEVGENEVEVAKFEVDEKAGRERPKRVRGVGRR